MGVLVEEGFVVEGAEGADRRPGELEAEWVVAEGRGRQASRPALELEDLSAGLVCLIDDSHTCQMVDARVESQLIQKDQSSLLRLFMELHHFRTGVRCSHEILPFLQAHLRHVMVQHRWDVADHDIGFLNQRAETVQIVDVGMGLVKRRKKELYLPFLRIVGTSG